MSETLDATTSGGKRPGFLSALCILTFIGSGLGLLGAIFGLVGASFISWFAPQGTIIVQIIALLAAALCLFGAVKMWGLHKQGFMLYLVGCILSIAGSVVSAMTVSSYIASTMSTVNTSGIDADLSASINDMAVATATAAAWTGVVVSVVINVLFIILYAVNRKHLTK